MAVACRWFGMWPPFGVCRDEFKASMSPPEAAFATLKGRVKGFTRPTFFKPSWTNRWVDGRLKSRSSSAVIGRGGGGRPPVATTDIKCAAHHRGVDLVVSYWAVSTV